MSRTPSASSATSAVNLSAPGAGGRTAEHAESAERRTSASDQSNSRSPPPPSATSAPSAVNSPPSPGHSAVSLSSGGEAGGAVTERILGAAIAVHRALGPGLLESAYEACLAWELEARGVRFERQVPLPVVYREHHLDCGYRLDLVVEGAVIVELKAVDRLLPIHEAQMLTYLKLSGRPLGLLLNFNVPLLKDGIRRFALSSSGAISHLPSASSAPSAVNSPLSRPR